MGCVTRSIYELNSSPLEIQILKPDICISWLLGPQPKTQGSARTPGIIQKPENRSAFFFRILVEFVGWVYRERDRDRDRDIGFSALRSSPSSSSFWSRPQHHDRCHLYCIPTKIYLLLALVLIRGNGVC